MTCLVLFLILSQVLCINDVDHYLFLPLNSHLILSCMSHVNLLGFPDPRIGMVFPLPATLHTTSVPKSYSQASTQECWRQAMHDELQALQDNHTWDIVSCPTGVKLIG